MASLVSENTKDTDKEENDIERHLTQFKNLKKADKKIFGNIFCICLNKVIKDDIDKQYCSRVLKNICGFLQLDNHDYVSIEPLLEQHSVISTKPFLTSLKVENVESYTQHFIVSVLHFYYSLTKATMLEYDRQFFTSVTTQNYQQNICTTTRVNFASRCLMIAKKRHYLTIKVKYRKRNRDLKRDGVGSGVLCVVVQQLSEELHWYLPAV